MNEKRLGRGLEVILSEEDGASLQDVIHIPVHDVHPNPRQPRKIMDEDALADLAESIQRNGILQPILVRQVEGGYEIIAGERRWRASQRAGLTTVPALVKNVDDRRLMELALVENLQREDLNPIEKAQAYREYISQLELTQEQAAERLGKRRSSVANMLRLLELPGDIQELVSRGTVSWGHARTLLMFRSAAKQREVCEKIVRDGLTVRQVEALAAAQGRQAPSKSSKRSVSAEIEDLESRLRRRFGTKVAIQSNGKKGKLIIEFFSESEFERLMGLLEA